VIPFASDGGLIFSFNGLETDPGFSNIEVMDFNITDGYSLFEIHFPAEGDHHLFTAAEIDESYDFAVFSKANPSECIMCHNPIVRPIWATYPKWPRMYGEKDDYYFYGGKSVVANWMSNVRYQVLDKEYPLKVTSLDAFYETDELLQRGRDERRSIDSYYRRNLVLSRIFSLQLAQLLVRDVSVYGSDALGTLKTAIHCIAHNKIMSALWSRIKDVGLTMATRVQGALLPIGLSVLQYSPLKARNDSEGFEDGAGGFRYLNDILASKGVNSSRTCEDWEASVEAWIKAHPSHDLL